MHDFRVVDKLQKFGEDISSKQLKYHHKRVMVSKEFTFDAAHHLHAYEGNDRGLMIDFGDIKKIWKSDIEIYLDHRYLNETLPPMNTTAENIVYWIFKKMEEALNKDEMKQVDNGARVEFVRLYETPTSFAEMKREWMEYE